MASNFVACESFYARHSASALYSGEWSKEYVEGNIDVTDNPILSAAIDWMPDQRPGTNYVVMAQGTIETDAPARAAIWCISSYAYWNINGVWVDNGGAFPIDDISTIGIGRQTAQFQFRFGGAAQTAIAALTGTGQLRMQVTYRSDRDSTGYWQDFATFGDFADVPPNVVGINIPSAMRSFIDAKLATDLARTGQRHLCGVNRYAEGASWSANDCTGFVIVESSDIGTSDNQIPSDVTNNTVARFKAHPSVFFRYNGDKCRGMAVRQTDAVAINTPLSRQPIGIYTNDSPIASCNWLLIVDGQPSIAKLYITSGSYYTPLQVWNNVLSPMLQGSDSIKKTAYINGSVGLNKTSFCSYARFLDRIGTPYTQINTTPPV